MYTANKIIKEIRSHYNIELSQIIEDEREYSKVEFYKNENTFTLDSNGNIIKLNLKGNNIEDLEGIFKVSNTITHLQLSANQLKNISLLSKFKNLEYLDLSTNKIFDITPLKNLNQLKFLYIDNNQINTIPKFSYPRLIELWIYSNNIIDINNLKYLKSIKSLNVSNNKIVDISVLTKLKNLNYLNVSKNRVIDISPLSGFKNFNSLDISNNEVIDISPLQNIIISTDLMIGQNKIIDLTPLYQPLKKKKINFVNAFENPLIYPPIDIVIQGEDLIVKWFDNIIETVKEKIYTCKQSNAKILDIGKMGLTDLSLIPELFELIHLKELIISNEWAEYDDVNKRWIRIDSENSGLKNNVFHIPEEFIKLKNLEKLIVGGDWRSRQDKISKNWRIKNIDWLFQLKKLCFLNISNNEVQNISGIINLKLLEIGHFNNNKINKVPKLNTLKNLKEIYLSNNLIEDVEFLDESYHIVTVDLHSNKIINLI